MSALLLALALSASPATAHDGRPAWVGATERAADRWDIELREPARGHAPPELSLRLPDDCLDATPPRRARIDTVHVERREVRCALAGREVGVDGLADAQSEAVLRATPLNAPAHTARLTPSHPTHPLPSGHGGGVARTYLVLGIEHILLGVDHLCFVLALLLIVDAPGRLVRAITGFTVAHSVTLVAATLGWVRLPIAPVEAIIALSIVFLCSEIVHTRQGRPGLAQRRTWLVALVFGLLHGLGFASALGEVGLPDDAIPSALLFFNLGVEAGQLLFVAAALPLLALARRLPAARHPQAWRVAPYALGAVAGWWFIERVAGFWG